MWLLFSCFRLIILAFIIFLSVTLIKSLSKRTTLKKPKNVLFIVADDLGWADIGYADADIASPNLNRLAREGIILNSSYAYSICTPSRNSILSGVYAEHTGLQHGVIIPRHPIGLPLNFRLMPEFFKELGYSTHLVGKWHLGFCNIKFTPVQRGFDTFYGFFNAEEDYYSHRVGDFRTNDSEGLDFWDQTRLYLKPVLDKNNSYSTFTFAERAIEILAAQKSTDKPFLMLFTAQNPHSPLQVPQEYEDKYYYVDDPVRRKYLAMVTLLDDAVGHLLKALKELDMLDDTIVAFTSDNGGETFTAGHNNPLRGGKFTVFEGGHRVRAFIHAKELKPYTYEGMFHAVDWLPTLVNAALNTSADEALEFAELDGMSQWASIAQRLPSNRTSFIYTIDPYGAYFCELMATEAIREGDWKLIRGCPGIYTGWYPSPNASNDTSQPANTLLLFNIREDPLEQRNLAAHFPNVVDSMVQRLNDYKKTMAEPLNYPNISLVEQAKPKYWGDKWSPGWC